jgi:4-amino-4-deoxy-L-arabinose transferase-like glycosyltransferase
MTSRSRTDALLLAGFCGFLFFYGLAQFGLIGADEPRYAEVAHEMLERRDWITPTLGGQPWLEKPPLYYWEAMIAYKVFGVRDFAARLPAACDATLLVLAVYFFLRRFRRGLELDGALMVASCAGMVGYARAASTDMPLTATFTVAMLAWWAWHESRKKIWLAAFFFFIALGMLAKGPVAPLLAALLIIVYAATLGELRLVERTLWLPGILLFLAVALPWYLAVEIHNPQFFHEFILEQNLGRFSENLYHHTQPFWYYPPVVALALVPWTMLAIAGAARTAGLWWTSRGAAGNRHRIPRNRLAIFALCWLIVPALFFSISESKLPGYILPSLPGGAVLLTEYLRQKLDEDENRPATWLVIVHALLASGPLVPGLLIAYLITQHRLPGGKPMFVALAVALVLCAGMVLTLAGNLGVRRLRFVTLIPVILTVGAVLKLGSTAIDDTFSARPLATEIAGIEMRRLPLAVYHVPRELEYGLTFYRDQLTFNYDWGRVPQEEHLLVAPENSQGEVRKLVSGRRVSFLGRYQPQHVDYFWIAAAGTTANR